MDSLDRSDSKNILTRFLWLMSIPWHRFIGHYVHITRGQKKVGKVDIKIRIYALQNLRKCKKTFFYVHISHLWDILENKPKSRSLYKGSNQPLKYKLLLFAVLDDSASNWKPIVEPFWSLYFSNKKVL